MPYISTVNERIYRVDTGENDQQRDITIDRTTYQIDWRSIAPLAANTRSQSGAGGRYSLIIAGRSYEVFARRISQPDGDSSLVYEVILGEQRFEVRVEDEREKTLAGSVKSAHDSGEARIRAPMPGLVISVPVETGAAVTRGQTVIVLEAMKMENDLAAPRSGIIKEIKVNQGQTVNQGDMLVIIAGEL
jgi:biotin carboxyl carrier protein